MNRYRLEGIHEFEFANDHEAFEKACGWHDDRDACLEKWINGKWCSAANPIYHPQFFYGKNEGGWMISDNKVIPFDAY